MNSCFLFVATKLRKFLQIFFIFIINIHTYTILDHQIPRFKLSRVFSLCVIWNLLYISEARSIFVRNMYISGKYIGKYIYWWVQFPFHHTWPKIYLISKHQYIHMYIHTYLLQILHLLITNTVQIPIQVQEIGNLTL